MHRKILIMGLPGAGKSTVALALARRIGAVHFNADRVRAELYAGALGFSVDDRIEHARRMGWLCDRVIDAGHFAIGEFICPTEQTRQAFGDAFVVWMDRISKSRFPDTDRLFSVPSRYDVRITGGTVDQAVQLILDGLNA